MKIRQFVFMGAVLGLAVGAFAADEAKMKMSITVIDDSGDGEVRFELDSDELGFSLHDMQEGENRSIVDESGRTILITRTAVGFTFDVDGKTIEMPAFDGEHHGAVWIGDEDGDDVEFHVMRNADFMSAESMDGIMIMSGKPIDEATQQAIKSLLESSGHGSDVRFIDHEGPHGGPHRVKVIKQHIEVKN